MEKPLTVSHKSLGQMIVVKAFAIVTFGVILSVFFSQLVNVACYEFGYKLSIKITILIGCLMK
jgi:hypothetical protein